MNTNSIDEQQHWGEQQHPEEHQEQPEQAPKQVGGVWLVAGVDAHYPKLGKIGKPPGLKVPLRNSFGALTKETEEDVVMPVNVVEVSNVNSKKAAKKRVWKPMNVEGQKESDGVGRSDEPMFWQDVDDLVIYKRSKSKTNFCGTKSPCDCAEERSRGCNRAPPTEEPGVAKPRKRGCCAEAFTTGIESVKTMEAVEEIQEFANEDDIRWICPVDKVEDGKCAMIFHRTNAMKILASVHKIVAAGNRVHFGETAEECFIQNVASKKKIMMKEERGVYTIKVKVMSGNREVVSSIVVDSGAAECVMPKDWYPESQEMEAKKGVRFAGANGNDLGNFGRKLLEFTPFPRHA